MQPPKVKDIISIMDSLSPEKLAIDWDNVGLQIGDFNKNVKTIFIALDLSQQTLTEAVKVNADLIITHHPLIFSSLKKIISLNPIGNLIMQLIKNDICLYVAHTNLDIVSEGVNDVLAKIIGLEETRSLADQADGDYGLGRIGKLPKPISLETICKNLKISLGLTQVQAVGDKDKQVRKVATCSGSGASLIDTAYRKQTDVYITGDIKYHDARLAQELGLAVIDVGHFASEVIIVPILAKKVSKELDNQGYKAEVIAFDKEQDPFIYM